LEDRLSVFEQEDLATHLELCAHCRQELERLAAASQFWNEACLLRGEADGGAEVDLLDSFGPEQPWTRGRLGPYEVLEVLGQGGMGVVLKARDPGLDRIVAVKVLNPTLAHVGSARRRFAREARAAAAVGHEHIVAIHAVDEFRGRPFLVMQYEPGRSLQERLDASGPLELKDILRIGTQAARALAAAHAQGVVHRDIKPANILLENCIERVKLTDFGLARAIDDASLTQSAVIAGTPLYMAPEQARGEPVDARSDLFSLGAVIYAMAGGRPPFRADSAMAVLKRVCDDRQRSIRELNPEIPDWLEALIDRLLAKEPADRFQTAAEVADLLERGLAHVQQPKVFSCPLVAKLPEPRSTFPDADLHASRTAHHTRRTLVAAAALALLALAGLGASEAAGLSQVTDFVATVLRIKTPEGTLVVKVDDPEVKVNVDHEEVIIGGAGPQEIRLRTGLHRVQATRNGLPVKDELVTIMKNKKEIVSIGFEPSKKATPRTPADGPPMTAPRSHAEQCIDCHDRSHSVDRLLHINNPALNAGTPYVPVSKIIHGDSRKKGDSVGTDGKVWSLAYSPDGRRLAIGQQGAPDSRYSMLRIWDVSGKKEIVSMTRPAGIVASLSREMERNWPRGPLIALLSSTV
jgi:serine/threonine-protein kinase